MATALSGSGPAYVFLFMEAIIDAGVHMGFSAAHRRAVGHRHPARLGRLTTPGASSTPPACATRSPPRAAPLPKRSTTWRKPVFAPPSRARFGLPTSAARRWVRARMPRNRINFCLSLTNNSGAITPELSFLHREITRSAPWSARRCRVCSRRCKPSHPHRSRHRCPAGGGRVVVLDHQAHPAGQHKPLRQVEAHQHVADQ